jgi:hypothetical protein
VSADTQHYSEQACLFEIAQTALLIKLEVIELSILTSRFPTPIEKRDLIWRAN